MPGDRHAGFGGRVEETDRPQGQYRASARPYGFDRAADVLDAWQRWVAGVDNRAWSTCKLLATPGDGSARATISGTWIGPATGLDGVLAPLLSKLGQPPVNARYTMSYGEAMAFEAGC